MSGRERKHVSKHKRGGKQGGKAPSGSKEWIVHKKDTMRKRGYTDIPQVYAACFLRCVYIYVGVE